MEINAEIEKDKLRSQERFELERLNLEKAKLELEAQSNLERVNMELSLKKKGQKLEKPAFQSRRVTSDCRNLNSRNLMVTH